MNRNKLIIIILLILTLLLRLPSLFEPYWHMDEGITLTVGQTLRNGGILYRDIADNKTPLLYVLAFVFNTVFLLKSVLFAWMLGTVIGFYLLAKKLVGEKGVLPAGIIFVILTSLPLLDGNIANGEIFFLGLNIFGILLTIYGINHERKWFLFWAGFCFSLATLFKFPAVFDLMGMLLFLIIYYRRGVMHYVPTLLYGFLIPHLLTIFYFILHNSLPFYFEYSVRWNLLYSSSGQNFLFPYGGLIFKAGLTIVSILLILRFRNKVSQNNLLIVILFIITLLGSTISTRGYIHYFLPVVTYFALLMGAFFNKNRKYFLIAVAGVTICWGIINFGSFRYQFNYYHNFITYITGGKNIDNYRNFFDKQVNTTYEIAEYLNTAKNGKIFIWGDNPLVYTLSKRLPVGRFSAAYNIHFEPKREKETIIKITNELPIYILYFDRVKFQLPGLDKILEAHYNLVRQIEEVKIYERKI